MQEQETGNDLIRSPKRCNGRIREVMNIQRVNIRGYKPNTKPHHGQILRAMNMIYDAKRPLFLIGGGAKIAGAQEEMQINGNIKGSSYLQRS